MFDSSPRRVFITGCGAVSPFGVGVPQLWRGLLEGRSALAPIRSFDTAGLTHTLAGEVPDYDPAAHLDAADAARLDRIGQYALTAAHEALAAAALDLRTTEPARIGAIVATTLGGMAIGERYLRSRRDADGFDARQLLHMPYAATATRLARGLGVRGPVLSPSIACASGTYALGLAFELIRRGQMDACVVGGAEALGHFVVAGFNSLHATTGEAVRPFDARRDGLALGEGAAMLVVESAAHAGTRGAAGGVEILGCGLSSDAVHMTAPARDGAGATRAMRAALCDAVVAPDRIEFISAHGTGTVYNDAMEMAAIGAVFGTAAAHLPVNSIKGAIGHTLGAAGSFEAIMCAHVLREGIVPPTAGCEQVDPACPFDVIRGAPRRHAVQTALSTSSAFAGNNAAIVLGRA